MLEEKKIRQLERWLCFVFVKWWVCLPVQVHQVQAGAGKQETKHTHTHTHERTKENRRNTEEKKGGSSGMAGQVWRGGAGRVHGESGKGFKKKTER